MTGEMSSTQSMQSNGVAAARLLGLLSIVLAVTLVAVHIPAQIYAANSADFNFQLSKLLWVPLEKTALIAGALSLPLLLPSAALVRTLSTCWFSIALAIWLSSSLLVLETGVLDGRMDEISIPSTFAALSLISLLITVITGWLLARKSVNIAILVVALLAVGQTVVSILAIIQDTPKPNKASPIDLTGLYRMSVNKNVLVILFDTFQSTFFDDLLQEQPGLRREFDGFTFYRNTVGVAPTTYASLPTVHSGAPFDPTRSLLETYKDLVQSESFLAHLAAKGYEVFQVNPIRGCPSGATCAQSPAVLQDGGGSPTSEYLQLLDISLMRVAPAHAKQWVFSNGAWFVQSHSRLSGIHSRPIRNQRLLSLFREGMFVSGERPAVKFLHMFTTHPPVELDAECEPLAKPVELTVENFAMPIACSVRTVLEILNRLKDLDVYDNTIVAIMADHGAGFSPSQASQSDRKVGRWNSMAGFAMPLLLVKGLGDRGPLQVSDGAAAIGDLGATICGSIGDCRSGAGLSLNNLPVSRPRSYFSYEWRNEFWALPTIPDTKQFIVNGPAWNLSSWSRTRAPVVPLDTNIFFQTGFTHHDQYIDWGWSEFEPWGVWSDGPISSLSFSRPVIPESALELIVESSMTYLNADSPTVLVSVTANRQPIAEWRLEFPSRETTLRAIIQPEMWTDEGQLTVQLRFDRDVDLDQTSDPADRMLNLGISSIRLQQVATKSAPEP